MTRKNKQPPVEDRPWLAQITLYDTHVHLAHHSQRGVVSKNVTADSLATALAGVPASTGVLPQNTVFYTAVGTDTYLGVYIKPGLYDLMTPQGTYRIPLPGMIFAGYKRTYELYALKGKGWPDERTPLYYPPTPNIFNNGVICQGEMTFPECTVGNIWQVWKTYVVGSYFTGHLASNRHKDKGSIFDFWAALQKKKAKVFPQDQLMPFDGKRLRDLVGKYA